jgi:UDP-GlcNAc:undecaprenyl-phosphate/decaprenyl-phosphate GlcNAc-1-phosphate transferase
MMISLPIPLPWLYAVSALLITALLLVFLIRLAPMLGLMDIPNGRKDHAQPTPLVGGVAILVSVLATAALLRLEMQVLALLICAMLVFLVGLLDDFHEISQYPRAARHPAAHCW